MTFMSDDIRVGSTVLYQAPGTSRDERVEATVLRTPTIGKPLYQISVGDKTIECCWFALDTLPKVRRNVQTKGVFGINNSVPRKNA